jgi:hypothetical protein
MPRTMSQVITLRGFTVPMKVYLPPTVEPCVLDHPAHGEGVSTGYYGAALAAPRGPSNLPTCCLTCGVRRVGQGIARYIYYAVRSMAPEGIRDKRVAQIIIAGTRK